MKKTALILMFVPILFGSCNLSSENPVSQSASIDTSVYTGKWDCVRFGGEAPSSQMLLTVAKNTNGTLLLTVSEGSDAHSQSAVMGMAGNKVIASVQGNSGNWELLSIDIQSNNTRLVVGVLDAAIVKQDIQSGVVTGEVSQIDTDTSLIRIKAACTNLAQYLSAHTNAFTEGFIFDKVP